MKIKCDTCTFEVTGNSHHAMDIRAYHHELDNPDHTVKEVDDNGNL